MDNLKWIQNILESEIYTLNVTNCTIYLFLSNATYIPQIIFTGWCDDQQNYGGWQIWIFLRGGTVIMKTSTFKKKAITLLSSNPCSLILFKINFSSSQIVLWWELDTQLLCSFPFLCLSLQTITGKESFVVNQLVKQ